MIVFGFLFQERRIRCTYLDGIINVKISYAFKNSGQMAGENMKIKFLKYEIISFIFFINACTWFFLDNYFSHTKYILFTFSNITILGNH